MFTHHVDAVKSYFIGDAGAEAIVDTRSNNDFVSLQMAPQLSGSRQVLGCITITIAVSVVERHVVG